MHPAHLSRSSRRKGRQASVQQPAIPPDLVWLIYVSFLWVIKWDPYKKPSCQTPTGKAALQGGDPSSRLDPWDWS